MSAENNPSTSQDAVSRPANGGMRHIALHVTDLDACVSFYTQLMGMTVEWNPDPDNFYLTSGNDNVALHRASDQHAGAGGNRLDHLGFIVDDIDDVDRWQAFLEAHGVTITQATRTHRDGARSFYCLDPDGNSVQLLYHPPISRGVT